MSKVGPPTKKDSEKSVSIRHTFPPETAERLHKSIPSGKRSQFVAAAVDLLLDLTESPEDDVYYTNEQVAAIKLVTEHHKLKKLPIDKRAEWIRLSIDKQFDLLEGKISS